MVMIVENTHDIFAKAISIRPENGDRAIPEVRKSFQEASWKKWFDYRYRFATAGTTVQSWAVILDDRRMQTPTENVENVPRMVPTKSK